MRMEKHEKIFITENITFEEEEILMLKAEALREVSINDLVAKKQNCSCDILLSAQRTLVGMTAKKTLSS